MNYKLELSYWINEREQMRIRREVRKLAPDLWTKDPSMKNVRYCNVRREDDKVTRWLAEHWRPAHHAAWEMTLARMLNYIPTLEELINTTHGDMSDLTRVGAILKRRRARGDKVFTSAYTISTCGESMDKVDYVMRVVEAVRQNPLTYRLVSDVTLADAHRQLQRTNGLGSFLAAQVVADLKNTRSHPLQNARDWWEWAAPGPGSLRGLNWYFHGRPVGGITASYFDTYIKKCYEEVKADIAGIGPLHMQDFQNCLCEYSKFMRVKYGSGRVRNNYRPG